MTFQQMISQTIQVIQQVRINCKVLAHYSHGQNDKIHYYDLLFEKSAVDMLIVH